MKSAQAGFSLIEAVVAIAILGILMSSVVPALTSTLGLNGKERVRREAVSVARAVIQDLGAKHPSALPMEGADVSTVARDGRIFSVRVQYCLNRNYCQQDTSRHVTVEVKENETTRYRVETVLAKIR